MTLRILLADDHPMFRQGLKTLLERDKFEVVAEAEDGVNAVSLARRLKPDIAVLDLSMPLLNGLDATRQIRESELTTQMILLSAYDEDAYVLEAQQAGARGYILKSQASSDLVGVIRKMTKYGPPRRKSSELFFTSGKAYRGPIKPAAERLTERERQILALIAQGRTTREAAEILGISVKTADSHRSHLMQKLEIHETASLVRYAVRQGIVEP
ncbi:MAG: response regulator [Gammaproteobacteria bacterium]